MPKVMRALAGVCAAIFAIVAAPSAFAQNVVTNGGFEGSLAPWVATGWGNFTPQRSGANAAGTGCVGATCLNVGDPGGRIHQDVVTTPGTTYTLTFWYRMSNASDTPVELQALLSNGVPTGGGAGTCTGNCVFQTQTSVGAYTQATATYVATSASTRITFLGRNDPAGVFIDDVSLVPVAPVPTLSEWAMILLGLMLAGGAAFYIQRRQMMA